MKNFLKIILFTFSVSLISCKKSVKDLTIEYLTNDSAKYWDVVQKPSFGYYKQISKAYYPLYSYCFYSNGSFSLLTYDSIKNRKIWKNSIPGDDLTPNSWKYINDSTIEIRERGCQIKKITEDTCILESSSKYIGTIILAKSQEQ